MKTTMNFTQFIQKTMLLTTLAITAVFFAYLYFLHLEGLKENVKKRSEVVSDVVFESVYTAMQNGGGKIGIAHMITKLEAKIPNTNITLHNADSPQFQTMKEHLNSNTNDVLLLNDSNISYTKPIYYKNACIQCHNTHKTGDMAAVITVESPLSDIQISLTYFTLLLAILILLVITVGFIVWSYSLHNYFFKPLKKLIIQLKNISSHHDLKENITIHSSIHELQEIEDVFNEQNQNLLALYSNVETSEKLLSSIINVNNDLIFYKDKDFNYLGCNEAFLAFVGKTKEQMIGHSDFELFNEEMATLFREMDTSMLEKNEISSNYEWVTYPDGSKVYLLTKKIPFHYAQNAVGILGISRDITELHLSQERLKSLSYIDELTKLHNRKAYNEKIKELFSDLQRYEKPFSMLMYDIDNFKSINDTFGHKAGDEVLIQMSQLVKNHIRVNDFLFRVGGEEFIILFPQTTLENTVHVAEKIRHHIEHELVKLNYNTITISAGLCEAQGHDDEDSLFVRVDKLLYQAKTSGKNRVIASKNN